MTPTTDPDTGALVPWTVTVGSGYGLSQDGDEINVPRSVRVDVREPEPEGIAACRPDADPWCAPVRVRRDPEHTYYLAVRYHEDTGAPVSVQGCGCGVEGCEDSRVFEGYQFAVLDELPAGYSTFGDISDALWCSIDIREHGTRTCPSGCSPWLILADLQITGQGQVTVDALIHRRLAVSFANVGLNCSVQEVANRFSSSEQETIAGLFSQSVERTARSASPGRLLSVPADSLQGADSDTIRAALAGRTVAQLAAADPSALADEAVRAGADPIQVDRLREQAVMVVKLARR